MHASLTSNRSRIRTVYILSIFIVLLLGLVSKHYPITIISFLRKYPSEILLATMVFFMWGILLQTLSTFNVAAIALASCFLIEFLKLYHAPWISQIRHTSIGQLILGNGFSIENLLASCVGVALALILEVLWLGR